MVNVDLYSQIFRRKSIRNYDLTPLGGNALSPVIDHINNLEPLHEDIKVDLKIITSDDVNPRMMKKAPYYIAVFSENKEGYKTNVGYMLQQMDLYFSANGWGSCWQGIPKPKGNVLVSSDLKFVILMAFGKANVPLHRTSTLEFKRKPLNKISNIKNDSDVEVLLEAARLAPSATNSQPWFFTSEGPIIHIYSFKPSILRAIILKKYIPIDIGIVLYHLKLAAVHFGKTPEILFDKNGDENSPHGYEYVTSMKFD